MKPNKPTLRIITALICGILWIGTAGSALAQENEALAKQLRAEGAQALREGRQEEALALYKQSLELNHHPNIEKFVKKLERVVKKKRLRKQRLKRKPVKPSIPIVEPSIPPAEPFVPNVEPSIPSAGNLTLEKTVFNPAEEIKVYFQASSAFAKNAWVGIIPSHVKHGSESVNDQHDLSYQYLNKRTMGQLTFKTPTEPGSYDFRMHDTDDNGDEITSVSWVVESVATGYVEPPSSFNGSSEWDSNFNKVHLTQNGNSFSGTYEYSDGQVTGTLEGRRLKGWWSESDDTHDCGPNSQWSGPYIIDFSGDGKSFTGTYGKCSSGVRAFESLVMDNSWHGTLLSGQISLFSISNVP